MSEYTTPSEESRIALLESLPDELAANYLADNLKILIGRLFEGDNCVGKSVRISGDEMKLLYQVYAWLDREKKINARRGRPRKWVSMKEKNKYHNDRRRGKAS